MFSKARLAGITARAHLPREDTPGSRYDLRGTIPVEFSLMTMEYGPNTIFVTGVAKVSKDDPIASSYQVFFVALILERETGEILDATCNTARDMTKNFINSILVGGNLLTGVDEMTSQIRNRFFGFVQKPLIAALKDAHNRFVVLNKHAPTNES